MMGGENAGRKQDRPALETVPGQSLPQAPPGLQGGNNDQRVMEINRGAAAFFPKEPCADLFGNRDIPSKEMTFERHINQIFSTKSAFWRNQAFACPHTLFRPPAEGLQAAIATCSSCSVLLQAFIK